MYACLLASGSPRGAEKLKAFLQRQMDIEVHIEDSGSAARRYAGQRHVDFCIINAPLPDEFGLDLAIDIIAAGPAQVLLIVPGELAAEYAGKGEAHGVLVIGKPLQPVVLTSALHWMKAGLSRTMHLEKKNREMQQKIESIRLVDRAKCVLIETLRMTEAQAHRHIERKAMDTRTSKAEVARRILQVYDA